MPDADSANLASMLTLKNFLLAAAAVLFVLLAVAAFKSPGGAWPLCIAGVALLVVAHFDRIAEVSASATGAKIVLQQVQEKVFELRRLVAISGRMHMVLVQRMGRWGPAFTFEEMEEIRQESETLMRDAGVDEAEINRIRSEEWDRYVHLDYVFWIFTNVDVSAVRDDWNRIRDIRKPGTPDESEALLTKLGALTDERRKRLAMYRFYVQNGRHQDPTRWANRAKEDA